MLVGLLAVALAVPAGDGLDTARIERLTGAKGTLDEKEGVFKVSVPRTDLAVTAAGVRVTPPMGLTSWAAFQRAGSRTMVMGDLVLLEDQVNPVMSAALDAGLEVSALHNHFFWDTPRVMFMHIGGVGDESVLASAVGRKGRGSTGGDRPRPDDPRSAEDRRDPRTDGRFERRRLQARHRAASADARSRNRGGDGRQHLGGLCGVGRAGGGRRRLRDGRGRAAGCPEGAPEGRYPGRRDPPPHDRRGAADHLPSLLGPRPDGRPRPGTAIGSGSDPGQRAVARARSRPDIGAHG
jgi:uncharacterized protein DUF1259